MKVPTPNADKGLAELEAIIRQTRRATLQEAARAVCADCDEDYALACDEYGEWAHYNDDGSCPCEAGPIHDLLAAMDKEGEHE